MLQLRTSIFPNIPPFINFIKLKEQYDSSIKLDIPWNLWINCNNPLLLHTFIRAGFVRTQVNQVKVVLEKLDSNQTWIGTGNSINLSLEIFSFLSENDHLRSLEKFYPSDFWAILWKFNWNNLGFNWQQNKVKVCVPTRITNTIYRQTLCLDLWCFVK